MATASIADTDWFFDWPSGYVRYRNGKREVLQDMKTNGHEEKVNRPSHYTSHPSGIEAIEVTKHEDFLIGNVLKYLWRRKFKGQELVDLKKARYYLDLAIQQLERD